MSAVQLPTCAEYCCQRSLCGDWSADGTVLRSIRGRVTKYFSFLNVQTVCGAHQVSDSVGSGVSLGRKACDDHLDASSAEAKSEWSCTSAPLLSWCH
jgi:hypothetical protein